MIQHRGIWLPDGEQHLLPHIDKGPLVDGKGTYQLHKLNLALEHTKGRRTVADVGAHVGTFSRILAKEFEQVDAFEPMAAHRECFRKNVDAKNVRLHRCALGAVHGWVTFTVYPGNSGHTHVAMESARDWPRQPELRQRERIPLRTLDSFELSEVDLIKIDTEGYELEVLKGAVETLQRWQPTLLVEQKPNNGSRYGHHDLAALPWLSALGARMVAHKAGDYVFTW